MAIPLITAAVALAEMVPMIARWFNPSDEKNTTTQMIAARVVDIAKKVTGAKDAYSAIDVLQKDPKQLLQFQKMVLELDHDMEHAFLEDRRDARARDVAMASNGRDNVRADIMVVCAALGLISCLASLIVYRQNMPGEAVGIISTIAGIFGSCLKDAYAFEFGSSRGSKAKDIGMMFKL